MRSRVLIIGATGLVGKMFLDTAVKHNKLERIITLTRREIPSLKSNTLISQQIVNFENPAEYRSMVRADIIICTLGTTIKKAGSQKNMIHIDYDIPMTVAEAGKQNGAQYYILVSSIGADPSSKIFYNRLKGELERDLNKLNFTGLHIIRPSLLIGQRDELRAGEKIAQLFAPIYKPFLPPKYKPIKAEVVAEKIHSICLNPSAGFRVYEGKEIY